VVPSLGDPQSLNRYSYVRNSPLLHTDPSGHREMNLADQARYEWTNQDLYYGAAYYDTGWGTGWTAHDTGVVALGLGLIAATAVVPEIIGAAAEGVTALIEAGTAATAAAAACEATGCLEEGGAAIEAAGEAGQAAETVAPAADQLVQNGLDFRTAEGLVDHFTRHAAEFGYNTPEAYLQGAQNLASGGEGVQTFVRAGGDQLFYRAATNEFGVVSADGFLRTYFRPEAGLDYWLSQIGGQ
jgi:pyocin large subunit-like protein